MIFFCSLTRSFQWNTHIVSKTILFHLYLSLLYLKMQRIDKQTIKKRKQQRIIIF